MKKTIKLILIVSFIFMSLMGCEEKEILLDPIAESELAEYLKGKDPVLDNDDLAGTYTIISRTCDKKTDDLIVSFDGSSQLYNYQARYQVKSTATKDGWKIDSFDIVDSDYQMKEITPSMLMDLLKEVDSNLSDESGGTYSLISKQINDNIVNFVMRYISYWGDYDAEYEGIAKIKDGRLMLVDVEITDITNAEPDPDVDAPEITLSDNYNPYKTAAEYGYTPPAKQVFNTLEQRVANCIEKHYSYGVVVTFVKILDATEFIVNCEVLFERRYTYVSDTEYWRYGLFEFPEGLVISGSGKYDSDVISNFEGVYVNKANGSYIIMHKNWKFELHEFYLVDGEFHEVVLKEYYRISSTSMKWQNRNKVFKAVWSNGAEPESFAVTILSI
ncbi:MAG TPA: hypothetical protein PK631_04555, partial [Erysipelotrichaceae bacterium]|nr:hypothetical protein [Erysipelotrichaceae bacterium]